MHIHSNKISQNYFRNNFPSFVDEIIGFFLFLVNITIGWIRVVKYMSRLFVVLNGLILFFIYTLHKL